MGLFGSLFGKSEKPITDPDRLRHELLAAARAGDAGRLEQLARANQVAVLEHFRAWQRVPEAIRSRAGAKARLTDSARCSASSSPRRWQPCGPGEWWPT